MWLSLPLGPVLFSPHLSQPQGPAVTCEQVLQQCRGVDDGLAQDDHVVHSHRGCQAGAGDDGWQRP
jgi:hypothetical protein